MAFDLSLMPNPRLVSDVREFIEAALGRILCDPDTICRVAMVAHELLENGTKYATSTRIVVGVTIRGSNRGLEAVVQVTNDALDEDVNRLREGIANLSVTTDPFHLYQTLMLHRDPATERSGLGLARVRAEAEMSLELRVEGSQVTILAAGFYPEAPVT